jgi:ubiquinone biosynthesis protein
VSQLRVQDLGRIREIARVLARHGFRQLLDVVGERGDGLDDREPTATRGRRVRDALVDLGPTFVKLGQILSLRPDILPKDILAECQTLQDRVPPMSAADLEEVLQSELGERRDQLVSVDPIPLGSASIAQVHRAVLADGSEVAVKVQRKDIERTISSDLQILYALARLTEGRIPIPGMFTPTAIVREFEAALTQELDFHQELRAAERLTRAIAGTGVIVPRVHPQHSTRRVLVMDLVRGQPLSARFDDMSPEQAKKIAHQLMEATWQQVFEHGFFHGDPHPGNLFVSESGDLVYLDLGITGLLTASMQDTIISTFTSMVFRDPDTLAVTIYRAGATRGRIDLREFRAELERKMVEYYGASLDDLATRESFTDVVEMATRFQIDLPSEYAILSRAVALVEASVRRLLPGVDIVAEVRPYAQRLMSRRFSAERLGQDAARLMFQLQAQLRDLPTHANQILTDLDGGRLTVITRDPDSERLREEVRTATTRISIAIFAGTTAVAAALLLAASALGDAVRQAPAETSPTRMLGWGLFALALAGFGALGMHATLVRLLDLGSWGKRLWGLATFFSPRARD